MARRVLLYGANGKPLRVRASQPAWPGAGQGRRAFNWTPTNAHINALLAGTVEIIRERTRQAIRENPWAKRAGESHVANLIGTGIRPKPQTDDDAFESEIREAWEEFVEECDADGTQDFYGLQTLVARGAFDAGDGLLRFRPRRPSDGFSVPLQLQALEAEMLDSAKNEALPNGRVVKAGIEFNALGQRTAYWMFRSHPDEMVRPFGSEFGSVPVPADQVVHIFHVLRAGQVRGVPGLATVLELLKEILEVNDAYVFRTKLQNLFAGFETTGDGESVFDDDQSESSPETDTDDVPMRTLEPGTWQLVPHGHDVKFSTPPQDAGNYADFLKAGLRGVAAGAGVTYEQLSGDLAGVTFSSIRAGLIEFRRHVEQMQHNTIVFQLCRRVWRRFFETAVLSGRLTVPEAERPRMRRLLRARWQPPGFEYVQPEQDIKAAVRRIRAGVSSREREAAKLGIDVEQLDQEIARDNARARALGLVFDSDPSSDADGQARAAAVGESGEGGEAGEGGESGRNAA